MRTSRFQGIVKSGAIAFGAVVGALVFQSSATTGAAATQMLVDRNVFLNATAGIQKIDFEGIHSPLCVTPFNTAQGLMLNGVQFVSEILYTGDTDPFHSLSVVEQCNDPNFDWGSGSILFGFIPEVRFGDGSIIINLPAGVTAFGTDFMQENTAAGIAPHNYIVTLSSGEIFSVTPRSYPNRAFVGFLSEVPISFLRIGDDRGSNPFEGNTLYLDEVVFGQVVPEPESIVLLAMAMAMASASALTRAASRRRHRAVPGPEALTGSVDQNDGQEVLR
jgi:hypothetical protein